MGVGCAALVLLCGPTDAAAAGAVFDAEFWVDARTTGLERVDDAGACLDAFSSLRRAIRSTTAINLAVYELRVGTATDVGSYEMWARLQTPPNSTRTVLVGQDLGGAFQEPADRFVITRGAVTGYLWLRITRQGSGTASAPQQDPWPVQLSMTGSDIEFRLVENDILIDRFAISNEPGYLPPDCPVDVSDGGPPGGDADEDGGYRGARQANCAPDEYYDRLTDRCQVMVASGCRALPPVWGMVALAALQLRRRRARAMRRRWRGDGRRQR